MNAVSEQADTATDHELADQQRVATLLADAVSVAREAIDAPDTEVGTHLEAVSEVRYTATHYFAADVPGYRGWQWCVVLAGCPDSDDVTVNEIVLLPGPHALTAPDWVPWAERVRAGDLNPGDLLASPPDDPRLEPGYVDNGDVDPVDPATQVVAELGLGRERLMTREARLDTAQRWAEGEYGPDSPMARGANHNCVSCGFYLPIVGALRAAFGVCANEYSADGRVVHADHGCGAHTGVKGPKGAGNPAYPAYDDGAVEIHANS